MIQIQDLAHGILNIPGLTIPEGVTTVIGKNGSGKTTLLSLCAGVAIPEHGSVSIDGIPPRGCEVGWVSEFPDRNILFDRVFDEIAAPLRFRHTQMDEIAVCTHDIAERFSITHLLSRRIRSLSGGEKVLVALATALVTTPDLLAIDEADSHLDSDTASLVQDVLRAKPPRYILQSTQYTDTRQASDHVILLENGNIRRVDV